MKIYTRLMTYLRFIQRLISNIQDLIQNLIDIGILRLGSASAILISWIMRGSGLISGRRLLLSVQTISRCGGVTTIIQWVHHEQTGVVNPLPRLQPNRMGRS